MQAGPCWAKADNTWAPTILIMALRAIAANCGAQDSGTLRYLSITGQGIDVGGKRSSHAAVVIQGYAMREGAVESDATFAYII